jgi:hypothetical protein
MAKKSKKTDASGVSRKGLLMKALSVLVAVAAVFAVVSLRWSATRLIEEYVL